MYGTLVNGIPVPAPNPLHVNNGMIYNPSGYLYESMGYKPIVETPYPDASDSDTYYAPHWEEQDGQIVRVWEAADPPDPEPAQPEPAQPTTEERLTALEGAMLAMMGGGLDV